MPTSHNLQTFRERLTLTSSLGVLMAVLTSAQTFAQNEHPAKELEISVAAPAQEFDEDSEARVDEVLVVGVKRNLMSAQAIKRSASTMVDAVSSEDIGLLPDYSVLDAMQRIPGVALERFSNSDDPDHFSTESTGVTIRGMSQSRSEFNGRDTFTANQGRALSYQDVPPELMGSIEVFKNQTADMVEGGIGGTVNLKTRKPFDSDERVISFNLDASYGDIARELSPAFSGLFSDRFSTNVGDFGVLLNYVHSTLYGESHGIQSATYLESLAERFLPQDNPSTDVDEGLNEDPGEVGHRIEDFVGEDNQGIVWVPSSANLLMKEDKHKREGMAAVIQYQSPDETVVGTFEYIRSDSSLSWTEKALKYNGGYKTVGGRPSRPLYGSYFILDDNGVFQAGTITRRERWRAGPSASTRVPQAPANQDFLQWGHITNMDSRVNDLSSLVEDASLKLEWQPNERIHVVADVQYVQAKTENDDVSVHVATWLNTDYDTRGSVPTVTYSDPWLGVRDATRLNDTDPGGLSDNIWDGESDGEPNFPGFSGDPAGDQNYFQDPDSYFWRSAMDHYERSNGDSLALRLDGSYDFDRGFVQSISAGVRYAQREQVVRSTAWNWSPLAPEWTGRATDWSVKSPDEIAAEIAVREAESGKPLSDWEKKSIELAGGGVGWLTDIESQSDGLVYVDWSDFMGGGVASIPGDQTIHASNELIRSVSGANPQRYLRFSSLADGNWQPYPTREGLDDQYGMFLPEDINVTTETRNALYLKLDFAGDGERPFSGNIGLRYVTMDRRAIGEIAFPELAPAATNTKWPVPDSLSLPLEPAAVDAYFAELVANGEFDDVGSAAKNGGNSWVRRAYNYLPDDQRAFGSVQNEEGEYVSVSSVLTTKDHYKTLLPSFNIKVDLTSELVGRFAFAKAVAFPDMGDVRNKTNFAPVSEDDIVVVERIADPDGDPATVPESASLPLHDGVVLWIAEGGNPSMQPMESIQYDISLEWYFSDVGQLSGAIFHKNLSNYFSPGIIYRDFTHPVSQETQTAAITSRKNGGDAKLDGVELTYHQFFGGMFEGFGIQATYTYVDANSVPNNTKDIENEPWFNSVYEDTGIRVNYDKLPLQGQSDHTVNLVGMYEIDAWSAHISYNWRSKYLLTTRDVITKAPQWYGDHGELDGSLFYTVNEHLTVGFQAINITNARTETQMILNDDLLSAGRSWFVSDRRIAFVLRGLF